MEPRGRRSGRRGRLRALTRRLSGTAYALGLAVLVLGVVIPCSSTRAQPPTPQDAPTPDGTNGGATPEPSPEEEASEPGASERRRAIEALRTRIDQLERLMAGTLSADVRPRDLFEVELTDAGLTGPRGERLIQLLTTARDNAEPARRRRRRVRPAPRSSHPDPLQATLDDLLAVYQRFFTLSTEEREAVLARHEQRRVALVQQAQSLDDRRSELRDLRRRLSDLQLFLRGELSPTEDAAPLLRLRLSAIGGLAMDQERLSRALATEVAGSGDPSAEVAEVQPDELSGAALTEAIEAAEVQLDRLRLAFLRRPESDRRALLDEHEARRRAHTAALERAAAEPEEPETADLTLDDADRAEQEALRAIQRARSQAQRRLAEERARVLGVRATLTRITAALEGRMQRLDESHEEAGRLLQSADAVVERPELDLSRPRDARLRYNEVRAAIRERLASVREALSYSPELPEVESDLQADDELDWSDVTELLTQTVAQREEVASRVEGSRNRALDVVGGDIAALNRARLDLLPLMEADYRERVTGFGPEGVEQGLEEFDHLTLFWRLEGRSATGRLKEAVAGLATSIPHLALTLIQLAAVFMAFWFWRRRADAWLEELEGPDLTARRNMQFGAQAKGGGWTGVVAYYVRRARRPLEWLILLFVVSRMLSSESVPEMRYLWILMLWPLGGAVVVRLVDAYAVRVRRSSRRRDVDAALRGKSLRLIGRAVVLAGLLLSLTETTVGEGTLYSWVAVACWSLPLFVGLVLARWWRSRILTTLRGREPKNRLESWVLAHTTGAGGAVALAVGGGWVLILGLGRWLEQELSRFETTQRILAAMFRAGMRRRSEEQALELDGAMLPASQYERLLTADAEVSTAASEELSAVVAGLEGPDPQRIAIVGERGLGKTTLFDRLADRCEGRDVIRISCSHHEGSRTSVHRALALALGLDASASREAVLSSLAGRSDPLVLVDDAHRLARVAVGGFAGLCDLLELTRASPGVDWVVTFDSPGWQYLERAQVVTAAFDQVIRMRRWTEKDIAGLLRLRAAAADLEPDFSLLNALRQSSSADDQEQVEDDYYRAVWDASHGNPGVALHQFAESFIVREGRDVLRLFEPPTLDSLDAVSAGGIFLLRAVLQLDVATRDDLARATALSASTVDDLLRRFQVLGLLEEAPGGVRVAWRWYRSVRTVLRRQHVLIVE